MGWLKRSSGRRYDSPSGVLHAIGSQTGKIIYSVVYKNQCAKCVKIDELKDKKDIEAISSKERLEIEEMINLLRDHSCVKNFEGHSKAMECDAICEFVSKAPTNILIF